MGRLERQRHLSPKWQQMNALSRLFYMLKVVALLGPQASALDCMMTRPNTFGLYNKRNNLRGDPLLQKASYKPFEGNAFTCPIVDGRMVDDNNDKLRFLSIRLAG